MNVSNEQINGNPGLLLLAEVPRVEILWCNCEKVDRWLQLQRLYFN